MFRKSLIKMFVVGMTVVSIGLCPCNRAPAAMPISIGSAEIDIDEQAIADTNDAINRFAFEIYDIIKDEKNALCSPYSIAMALSVLSNGANGETQQEILDMLGITDLEEWNNICALAMENNQNEGASLYLANSLWLNDNIELNKSGKIVFIPIAEDKYRSETIKLNFAKDNALEKINQWVADNTNDMIDPFLNELDSGSKLCIVNAISFEGTWTNEFDANDTSEATFYGVDKEQKVDMMYNCGNYKYFKNDDITAIELPYGEDEAIAMDIFITNDREGNISDNISAMSTDKKMEMIAQLAASDKTMVDNLYLPKFSFETELLNLTGAVQNLGMTTAFSDSADFTTIADAILVNKVLHKAKIIVDEAGTKAAAATAIIMVDGAVAMEEQETGIIRSSTASEIQETTESCSWDVWKKSISVTGCNDV